MSAGHDRFARGRHAGFLIPLFSMPSTRSWGIGEFPDLALAGAWLSAAGLDLLQVLPVNELSSGETSPYSAFTAMALDPMYIAVHLVEDFVALGGEEGMTRADRRLLAEARASERVRYDAVRRLKWPALRAAFERFERDEWGARSRRAAALADYIDAEAWWLDDYALFRALHERHETRAWTSWPPGLRQRDAGALAEAKAGLSRELLFYQYLQWVAASQWQDARAAMGAGIFGDFPFMVDRHSADVWSRQEEFLLDASVGTPPDAFSATGQDWGLPAYDWEATARTGYAWLHARARRSAALFDGYRVDHLVGFYRTCIRPRGGGQATFVPAGETSQIALGERLMKLFLASGPRIVAEDLGTVPDFVRASLARLGIPGYRVLRWEREWEEEDQPFRDPREYPAASVATTGTHDMDPLVVWWETAPAEERRQLAAIPSLPPGALDPLRATLDGAAHAALIELLFRSGSDFLILPVQDVFGWRDRVNLPGTTGPENWTWRLPWPVDRLATEPEARARAEALASWAASSRRGPGGAHRAPASERRGARGPRKRASPEK